ncbi:MAG: hypothetical protein U0Q18_11235 [Bryobacteraceae bacterium]
MSQAAASLEIEEEELRPRRVKLAPAEDPVAQTKTAASLNILPLLSELGLGSGFSGPQGAFPLPLPPPDTTVAVGATQVVQSVNSALAVFDKSTGAVITGPIANTSLWAGFSNSCSDITQTHDPLVLYDKLAGRWVVELVTMTTPYLTCMAVSTSSDATGTYNLYAFQSPGSGPNAGQFMATWPDAYYLGSFGWTDSLTYIGPAACAVDRMQMLAGQAANMQCIQVQDDTIDGMVPADLDGSNAPPAGSPAYYLVQGPLLSNSLYLYRFHVDFANPSNSALAGPVTIGVSAYVPGPYSGTPAVPQPGTNVLLDVNGNILMNRVAYRNFPRANPPRESLVATHSVALRVSGAPRLGLRWYELRQPGSTPVVYQQGTYAPDASSRWMGSIAMDKIGDIALGYSVSSSSVYPSIRLTGRAPTDPIGKMRTEVTIVTGAGSQAVSSRWGDYSSMNVDPADGCTMWYSNQYVPSSGIFVWATQLYSFKFAGCK